MLSARARANTPRLRWLNAGLQRRITLYVAAGSVLALLFFGYVARQAVDESTRIIFRERLHLARLAAGEVARFLAVNESEQRLQVRDAAALTGILTRFTSTPDQNGRALRLSVLGRTGTVVATTEGMTQTEHAEHLALLGSHAAHGDPEVVIHEPSSMSGHPHVVAFTPLPDLPGGVMLEQHEDEALAVPRSLQHRMSLVGLAFVATGLALAWFTTRQVVGPLSDLTRLTQRIAAGDLASPVPVMGQDEVRQLAASFETMRQQLQESHAELARANQKLEHRVEERTRELVATSRRLRQREAERTFLLQKTIQAQEEERLRVARELHDAVGQFLSGLVIRISSLEDRNRSCPAKTAAGLVELRTLASRAVGDVRRLVVDLRPELLEDMGLSAALSWYAQAVLEPQGVKVVMDVDSLHERLPAAVEIAVFRVVQEALTNVLKHARARNVEVSLQWVGDDLVGEVKDDGVGFDRTAGDAAEPGAGVGLIGMRERMTLLGGTLEVTTAPGKGTSVAFRVPGAKEEL